MDHSPDITRLLKQVETGDQQAAADLLPLVYEELRMQAAQQMTQERGNHTLQATALVHDAYLRIAGSANEQKWDSRAHFYAAAAKSMRRILIDHARSKSRQKRGGNQSQLPLQDVGNPDLAISPDQLLELDDALQKLERNDEQVATLVRLRLYACMSVTDAAKVLEISRSVAYELWDYALAWFAVELGPGEESRSVS